MAADNKGPVAGWEQSLMTALPNAQYAFEPGTHAAASYIEDAVLALALSRAARQPYAEYVQEKILAPLGMSHSRFSMGGGGLNPVLQTTIADLARFASFLMLGGPEGVLSRNELEENYRRVWVGNSVAVPNPSEWFGIGYDGETWTSNHYYFIPSIGSTQPGFDASFWFEPRRHAGVILLHQGGGGGALGQMIHTYVYTLNAEKVDAGRQDPVKPFPYTEEEVSFENKAAEIKLAGSLTIPSGTGPFPAVVLIPKSGPMDRDERILNHRPFLVLADYLTRAGIAVLRTDVRGVAQSGGKFAGAQVEDFAGDADAALEYLRTRKEVNASRVGLVSHGEGGRAAAITAARNRNAAFVVMLGAAAVPAAENSVEGSRLSAEANGELYAKAEAQSSLMRGILTIILRRERSGNLGEEAAGFSSGQTSRVADRCADAAVDLGGVPDSDELRSRTGVEEHHLSGAGALRREGLHRAGQAECPRHARRARGKQSGRGGGVTGFESSFSNCRRGDRARSELGGRDHVTRGIEEDRGLGSPAGQPPLSIASPFLVGGAMIVETLAEP